MNRITKITLGAATLAMPALLLAAPADAAPKDDGAAPRHAACGSPAPQNRDPISAITGGTAGARIRSGSAVGCTARGSIQPSHRLDYYCYTTGNDNYTWTYLRDVDTRVQGWVRDDLLPNNGSNYLC
ncbi:SH3 domain-containing protein [Actinosynnema sp. NPDC023587]|uniref:SH3 domain-containing protein n=1 Tax=Actinosynnema sp. NPDC023587 TaxID=3154695 RepID=UPI00340DF61D